MTEKRYEVAVYDDKAINGYCVLDKNQASFTARLGYKNVFISSEYGCEIVARLLNDKEHTINEMAKTIRIYDDGYIDLNKKYKKVVDENEQLKKYNKGQELEIIRLHNLADAMSAVLKELGIYDVYNDEQIENVKRRIIND